MKVDLEVLGLVRKSASLHCLVPLTGAIPRTAWTDGRVASFLIFKLFFLIPSGPELGVDLEWACLWARDSGGGVAGVLKAGVDWRLAGVAKYGLQA